MQRLGHGRIVAGVARDRSRDPVRACNAGQVKPVVRLFGELLEVLQLGTPVALAEGVDGVDIGDNDGSLLGEIAWREAPQVAGLRQPPMNVAMPVGMYCRNWNCWSPLLISTVRSSPAQS